ncbi:programmed cell death 1 ligand 1 [Oreochromis niloticus]|uniref:programmed cell death 1 ligand 1 n=1 Tax=Oreochromis niloticus TaxID=8128 RepID=UPI000DF2B80D|nr:programmed cell death 1 ligand 1-like [Oreochromis niloticus]
MDVLITTSHLWILFAVIPLKFTSTEQKNITAESGQDVTLTCRAQNNNIDLVEWNRTDLEDKPVFVYRNNMSDPENQHPSFKNRVDLQDRQMKDGDVSLILKNVMINDTGTYECRVNMNLKLNKDPISSIYLHVADPPGQTGGHTEDGGKKDGGKEDGGAKSGSVGLIVGLVVPAVLLVGVAVFMI